MSVHPSLILNKVISTKRHHSDILSSKQMSSAQGYVWFSENILKKDFIMFDCLNFLKENQILIKLFGKLHIVINLFNLYINDLK